ncbi:MAG: OsmC family protein [Elusimicrobia bacterium]|nr:OsmC family protein [Elusimicrobiota bacterium]
MQIKISFPGNKRVAADLGGFQVVTDQPKESGGDGSAPSPFELFLASIGTCAGIFVLGFCQKRGLPTEGLGILQEAHWDDAEHRVSKVSLTISLPKGFPEKYRDSLVSAANLCTVKKHLAKPPEFEVAVAAS